MKIYKKELKKEILDNLVSQVRSGKYKEINEEKVKKEVIKYLRNTPAIIDKLDKKKERDALVKNIKKTLYKGIGAFAKKTKEHISTQDRDYDVYLSIFNITGFPKKIVDLGAGLNPLMYDKLGCKPEYIEYEINKECVDKVNKFFSDNKIKGEAYCEDVLELKLPKADVYFLFKLLESVELVKSHKISEELIKSTPSNWVVISFATKTLSGLPMRVPKRRWVELMLTRLCYEYNIIDTENEMFYVIHK